MATVHTQLVPMRSWIHIVKSIITEPDTVTATNLQIFYRDRWQDSVYLSVTYLILVYFGRKYMNNRQPFNLRMPLAIWSGLLSMFSLVGTIIVWPEFIRVLRDNGFVATYCSSSYAAEPILTQWYCLFVMSKALELIDTAFIVLRKQALLPLHWIHHMLTLVYSFYVFSFISGTARWMVSMNFAIHTVMYGYFCLKALRFTIPRFVSVSITTMQIIQMIFGLIINTHMLIDLVTTKTCDATHHVIIPGVLMYGLYFYFFVSFFYKAYVSPKVSKAQQISNGVKSSNTFDQNNNSIAQKKSN